MVDQLEEENKKRIPIDHKINLTVAEAAEYSNIGQKRIEKLLRYSKCPFLLCVGIKKLIKMKLLLRKMGVNGIISEYSVSFRSVTGKRIEKYSGAVAEVINGLKRQKNEDRNIKSFTCKLTYFHTELVRKWCAGRETIPENPENKGKKDIK